MVQIRAICGDITKINIDAIVNAANTSLLGGGGVDGAIHRAAGKDLLDECWTLNGCKTGEAKLTKGYKLPAKFVIHTAGPVWHGGHSNEDNLLADCYINSLLVADQNNIKKIAFPAISTGVYGFPAERAAKIAFTTVQEVCSQNDFFDEIIFVCFDADTLKYYDKLLKNS